MMGPTTEGRRRRRPGGTAMDVERSRITFLLGGAALGLTLAGHRPAPARAQSGPAVTVYKSPT